MFPGHVHHRALAGPVDGPEHIHVAPAEAQRDTVAHWVWLLSSARDKPKHGSQAHPAGGPSTTQNQQPPTRIREEPRNEHLSGTSEVGDTGADVHGQPRDILATTLNPTRVNTSAYFDP
jgi:hypothetical protein